MHFKIEKALLWGLFNLRAWVLSILAEGNRKAKAEDSWRREPIEIKEITRERTSFHSSICNLKDILRSSIIWLKNTSDPTALVDEINPGHFHLWKTFYKSTLIQVCVLVTTPKFWNPVCFPIAPPNTLSLPNLVQDSQKTTDRRK
jgi:hypothetical protein